MRQAKTMNLPVDLAAASREELEELIEVVGQLLSYIGTLVRSKHASLSWKGRQSLQPTV